jgi:hypothetical protein
MRYVIKPTLPDFTGAVNPPMVFSATVGPEGEPPLFEVRMFTTNVQAFASGATLGRTDGSVLGNFDRARLQKAMWRLTPERIAAALLSGAPSSVLELTFQAEELRAVLGERLEDVADVAIELPRSVLHTLDELRGFYTELWRQAQREGVWMRYEYRNLSRFTLDVNGWYERPKAPLPDAPAGHDAEAWRKQVEWIERPQIHIVRSRSVPPETDLEIGHDPESDVADLPDELLTLAHEYGHVISDRRGWRTLGLIEALEVDVDDWPTKLSDRQRGLIFDDEERAWTFGWGALAALGYRDRAAYDRRRDEGLAQYRSRLPHP